MIQTIAYTALVIAVLICIGVLYAVYKIAEFMDKHYRNDV